jgi:hypothetical protein
MSSGSLAKRQIHLKIDPGSVRCSAQLEVSNLSIRAVRKGLNASQCLLEKLKQTNLSFDSDIEELERANLAFNSDIGQTKLHQPDSLAHGDILSERSHCYLQPSDRGQVDLHLNPLERVIIHQEIYLFPGVEVQLTDSRFKWKGIIVENAGDRALVNWGGSERWHALYELCLLVNAKPNIFQIALRRCASHVAKPVVSKPLPAQPMQLQPPQPDYIQTELFKWDCFEDSDF